MARKYTFNITAEEIRLTNKMSVPLALTLNELLTNAAKHGINGRATGEIEVSMRLMATTRL